MSRQQTLVTVHSLAGAVKRLTVRMLNATRWVSSKKLDVPSLVRAKKMTRAHTADHPVWHKTEAAALSLLSVSTWWNRTFNHFT